MKDQTLLIRCIISICFLIPWATGFSGTAESGVPEITQPVPQGEPSVRVPIHIKHLVKPSDRVKVRVRVGLEGEVLDFVPLEVPHRGLLEQVDKLVPTITFTPAMENGQAIVIDLDLTLPVHGFMDFGVAAESGIDHIESMAQTVDPDEYRVQLVTPKELDKPLSLAEKGKQIYAVDDEQNVIKGETVVDFYVDPQGVPRLIRPSGDSPPLVQQAAVETVSGFRFVPPVHNRNPAVVKGRITIRQGS